MSKQPDPSRKSTLRLLANSWQASYVYTGFGMGLLMLLSGLVMLLLPFFGQQKHALSNEELIVCIFGVAAMTSGLLLFVTSIISQLAHEIIIEFNDYDTSKEEKKMSE